MIRKIAIAAAALLTSAPIASAQTRLEVYSAGPAPLIRKLAEAFTAKTGVGVDIFQGTTGRVVARLEAEAGNPKADVFISASWDNALGFAKKDWLAPYRATNAASIPSFLQTPYAVAEGVSALGIAWRPGGRTPKPDDWGDLAKPAFKNLVVIPDPAQSGASLQLTAALQAHDGGWSLFKKLAKNGAVVADANAQALSSVLQGAKAAVFGAVDYISYAAKARGEKIDMIFPSSGTVVAPRPMMIMKWTKHPKAAKQFLDFVLSDAGQKLVADAYLMPARSGVGAKRPLLKDLKLLPFDADQAQSRQKAILAGFAEALGRP